MGFIDKQPSLRWLPEDDRIYTPIEQLLGQNFVWIGSAGNLYVGDTGWHPDGSKLDYGGIKVVFYLDSVAKDSGCLRVIPGSHWMPLHQEVSPLKRQRFDSTVSLFAVPPHDVPSFVLESQPGDVVFFSQDLWHASFGGCNGCRMLTMNFAATATTDEHTAYLQQGYENDLRNISEVEFTHKDRLYDDAFLHSDRPRIKGMMRKLVELGFK